MQPVTETDAESLGPRVGILTSGGDSPGMNAAIRAVVRTTLGLGGQPYAVLEGWQGAVRGGDGVKALGWGDVSAILHRGGTVLGTARCPEFRERAGLRAAALNLVTHGIDRLVVIGGDGSLRGTEELRQEWPGLLDELVASGDLAPEVRDRHHVLRVVGLVGSIDNDMAGTDMTIGADTALHRIMAALDALTSTAASHQRTFVVEVMGRHCGYLALMAAIAGGCDTVLVPEDPPADSWRDDLVAGLQRSRATGQRDLLVIVAEGATDRHGVPITSADVEAAIGDRMGERARVTILGHVQRGGRPSAYDRWMPTMLGFAAAREVVADEHGGVSRIVGVRHNRVSISSLTSAVEATNAVKRALETQDFESARIARGRSFTALSRLVAGLSEPPAEPTGPRIAVLHAGGLAPGMNAAVRSLVRFGQQEGMRILGVEGSLHGLVDGRVRELGWAEVDDWVGMGGAVLGTRRTIATEADLPAIAEAISAHQIEALVLVGGLDAYRTAAVLDRGRQEHPGLAIPVVCLPATIDNNLPGAELSIGADTALNTVVDALDKIRTSASATKRCFVAETKGGECGYLTLLSGLAAGAERVHLPEDELALADLAADATRMTESFKAGRQLYLVLRSEGAAEQYPTDFAARIYEEEGGDLFDVRCNILGHVQEGADPTPFDRLLATRLARAALDELGRQLFAGEATGCYLGEVDGGLRVTPIGLLEEQMHPEQDRPLDQWWIPLRRIGGLVSDWFGDIDEVQLPILHDPA
ncbi:6-phosphofructokinase [Ornithinimicrobium panacihumi]|uniref:6-phosphofructokinase n=1 Tax=Ornithinimicrobium panacihumi TaxID=2008449 RepID=UPI003F88E7E4